MRTSKPYYTRHACTDLKRDFPDLVSYDRLVYDRLVALVPRTLLPLVLADRCARSLPTGIYYIDSTPVKACHVKRAHQHQTLKGFANWGKSSVGWFFGLKIDLLINHLGQLVQVRISSGSTADSNPKVLFDLTNDLAGWVFGDKGYLLNVDQLELVQHQQQLHFVAKPRKAIKKPYLPKALFAFGGQTLGQERRHNRDRHWPNQNRL